MLTRPELTDGFQGIVFIDKIGREVCRVHDLPLISLWGGNRIAFGRSHQPSGSSQSGVYVFVVRMLSPFSTWVQGRVVGGGGAVGSLNFCRTLRYMSDYCLYPFRKNSES